PRAQACCLVELVAVLARTGLFDVSNRPRNHFRSSATRCEWISRVVDSASIPVVDASSCDSGAHAGNGRDYVRSAHSGSLGTNRSSLAPPSLRWNSDLATHRRDSGAIPSRTRVLDWAP